MRNVLCIILILTLLCSIFVPIVFAKDNETTSNLRAAKLLKKNDIMKIAEYHIKGYLKDDIQTKGKEIVPSKEFINLYDLEDNLFAYIIPLVEKGIGEIGFMTVGAIEDGYNAYHICINDDKIANIKLKIKDKNNIGDAKLVFIPPASYVVKVEEGKNNKFFNVTQNIKLDKDVTDIVNENKGKIKKIYDTIRSKENKTQTKNILESFESDL